MDEHDNQGLALDDGLTLDSGRNELIDQAVDAPDRTSTTVDDNRNTAQRESPVPVSLQLLVDRALHFLSHASNETIGACIAGLSATTYLILGRVGLVLIGVVGGIVLHATWEGPTEAPDDKLAAREKEAKRRRELGLEVVHRVWRWRDDHLPEVEDSGSDKLEVKVKSGKTLDFSAFESETSAALETFTTAVIRDYVKWWYAPVLPGEESFPLACRQILTAFFLSLSTHLSRKRPADMFLDFVTNSSSIIIVFLNELSAALNASPHYDAPTAIDTYLQLKPDCSLTRILDAGHQEKKLEMVAEDILQNYLDTKAYNCAPVNAFLKQILAKLILAMTIETCSKPEWINGWIVYLLEDGEPELMQAIDASVDESPAGSLQGSGKQVSIKEPPKEGTAAPGQPGEPKHKRTKSRAEEAMDDAMREAQRLTALIAEEEARREREQLSALSSSEDISESATQGVATPTSSQSDNEKLGEIGTRSISAATSAAEPEEISSSTPTTTDVKQAFTSFDQLPPEQTAIASDDDAGRVAPKPILTLFNANVSIFDDSMPTEKAMIRSKPLADYLIQIEPASSAFPGWMIARKYADFETLHEVLRRISVIAGIGFTEGHNELPTWKMHTKASLRGELERYLTDAARYQQLAESEGMKRFLEKDQGLARSPSTAKGFGWPTPSAFDAMGKGMMDVLTKAPKEVAGGGKAFLGGVTSVLGGGKKATNQNRLSVSTSPAIMTDSYMGSIGYERESSESIRSIPVPANKAARRPSTDTQASGRPRTPRTSQGPQDPKGRPSLSSRSSTYGRPSGETSRSSSVSGPVASDPEPSLAVEETFNLPPPPSMIDEYEALKQPAYSSHRPSEDVPRKSPLRASFQASEIGETPPRLPSRSNVETSKEATKAKPKPPMSEQETQVTVELLFAVITELYTLSSAWNIRRTLLNAAKTFLLRPGNPQLEAIRVMIQNSVIDSNSSDAGIAALILKVRENSLPTEEELKKWPAPMGEQEKEELRMKARKLLVERGMPQALTSVMGAAASGEALGKVFDCLQVERVAKSMIFGLTLQGLRAFVQ